MIVKVAGEISGDLYPAVGSKDPDGKEISTSIMLMAAGDGKYTDPESKITYSYVMGIGGAFLFESDKTNRKFKTTPEDYLGILLQAAIKAGIDDDKPIYHPQHLDEPCK